MDADEPIFVGKLQGNVVPARYQGQRYYTARILVCNQAFDLGLADTTRACNEDSAREIMYALHRRAGQEPGRDADELAAELCSACRLMTNWKPPAPKVRKHKRRAGWHWKTI